MWTVDEANEAVTNRVREMKDERRERAAERSCVVIRNAPEAFYAESNLAQFAAQGVDIQRGE